MAPPKEEIGSYIFMILKETEKGTVQSVCTELEKRYQFQAKEIRNTVRSILRSAVKLGFLKRLGTRTYAIVGKENLSARQVQGGMQALSRTSDSALRKRKKVRANKIRANKAKVKVALKSPKNNPKPLKKVPAKKKYLFFNQCDHKEKR